MTKLPIYEALISSEDDGIITISLVDDPAVESDFVCFAKDGGKQLFALSDTSEHLITGCLMKADTPIYRNDNGYEYYIVFSKETIKTMAQKMLADSTFKNIDLQHNGELLPCDSLILTEVYIKDSNKGIDPNFVDIPDGSLMTTFKVVDESIWQECVEGEYLNGFSLEGFFDTKQIDFSKNKPNKINSFKMRIKEMLRRMLAQFGEVSMDELTLYYEGDGEIEVGTNVTDIDGNPVADGEYHNAEMTVKVVDGKVDAIEYFEKENDDEPETDVVDEELEENDETVVDETVVEEPANEEPVVDIEKELADLRSMVEELKKRVDDMVAEPVVDPIEEEFSKKFRSDITDKKVQRAVEIARALHSKA
jgi:hypothetical protein